MVKIYHKKLKIAIVVGPFPCTSETFVIHHIKGLIEDGHHVDIFSFGIPEIKQAIHDEIKEYDMLNRTTYFQELPKKREDRLRKARKIVLRQIFVHPGSLLKCIKSGKEGTNKILKEVMKIEPLLNKRYNIVHCHFGTNALDVMQVKDFIPKLKFFVTFHGYDIRRGLEAQDGMYNELFDRADGIIAICDYNKKRLTQLGCPEDKLIDIPNGIDMDQFKLTKRKKGNKFIITTVARLVPVKNIPMALNIMKEIKDEGKFDFQYCIIGDGPLRKELEEKIRQYDLSDNVLMLGFQDHNKVRAQLAKSHIFLLTSENEAFPVVLLEAQAMGLPVVATNVGGLSESVIDGQTGYLIPENDVTAAKNCIYSLLDDFALLEEMGKKGREFIELNYNIKDQNHKLIREYEKSIGKKRR